MGVIPVYLDNMLTKCPASWQKFVRHHNPDNVDEDLVDKALEEYGALIFELTDDRWVVVFPNKEAYTRFILTWG